MTGIDLNQLKKEGTYQLQKDKCELLKLEVKYMNVGNQTFGPWYFLDGNIKIWSKGFSILAEIQIKPLGFFYSDITSKMMDYKLLE